MTDLNQVRIFRMTHIDNMPHILEHGITHGSSPNANPHYRPIGDGSLIGSRSTIPLPNGKLLGSYIPFYFGPRMPMLYVIQKGFNGVLAAKPDEIVYCVSNIGQIVRHKLPFIFTDGHAVDKFSAFFSAPDVVGIEKIVDFAAVREPIWIKDGDQDLKRRKEAEFLVNADIPLTAVAGYVVYNEAARQNLVALQIAPEQIIIKKDFYF